MDRFFKALNNIAVGILLMAVSHMASAEVVVIVNAEVEVIVNAEVEVEQITRQLASAIFLGKTNELPDGTELVPYDQKAGTASRVSFYNKATNKTEDLVLTYWTKLIFNGKGYPPEQLLNDLEVLEQVASDEAAIGFVDSSVLNDEVKVVLSLK